MNDDVLDRIVDLVEKIKMANDFKWELHDWKDVSQYSTPILSLIATYRLSAEPSPPPLLECDAPVEDTTNAAPARAKTRAAPRCSECGVIGHYSKSLSSSQFLYD